MQPEPHTIDETQPYSDTVGFAGGTIIAILSFVFLVCIAAAPDHLIVSASAHPSELIPGRIIGTGLCLVGMIGGLLLRRENTPK